MPTVSEAFSNAVNQLQARLLPDAEQSCREILAVEPTYADAWHLLGVIEQAKGNHDLAAVHLTRCIALNPSDAEAHNNLGVALRKLQQSDDAIASFRIAVQLAPQFAEAQYHLGSALHEQGSFDQAVACYLEALRIRPDFADAVRNLANALRDTGKFDQAIACYRRAIELRPQHDETFCDLATALYLDGKAAEAVPIYSHALALNPQSVEALNRLGVALTTRRQLDEALACFERALELQPKNVDVLNNMGNALKDVGKVDLAIDCYQRALAIRPDFVRCHSNLLYTIQYSSRYDARAIYEEHRRWNDQHAKPLAKANPRSIGDNAPNRKLRIGYVSPCFRNHCQTLFTIPLFSSHDHSQFEIICYHDDLKADEFTQRLKSYADQWRDISSLTDDKAAEQIREDQIDILVDLTMHMAHARPLLFARKPAPVQICWLAYPGTTGMTAMDYRLTDPYLDPPGADDECYAEKSFRLADTFWCYDPLTTEPAVNSLPALKNGFITFGSLNNFCKVNEPVLKLWAQVLRAVDHSQLMLLAPETRHRSHVTDFLTSEGISSNRIRFADLRPRSDYLQLYHQIDLGLDTFPYNGHTTSLDSYWMGVPVVTLAGETVVGRAGVSQLMNLALPELIARSPDEFVAIACGLANDLPRLSELRSTLRSRMQASPLMNGPRFARKIEAAYREIWRANCASL